MKNTTNTQSNELSDAFYALSIDERPVTASVVDEYVRRHPTHAAALTEFAIELAIDRLRSDASDEDQTTVSDSDTSVAVSKAISAFHNRVHAIKAAKAKKAAEAMSHTAAVNPFDGLTPLQYKQIVAGLQLNALFVNQFRDRRVKADTIPQAFVGDMSNALNVRAGVLVAHLEAPQSLSAGQRYRSDTKPEATRRLTFTEAVETSNLPPDVKRRLLSL